MNAKTLSLSRNHEVLADKKAALAPKNIETWQNSGKTIFEALAVDQKTKQLRAVAFTNVTQLSCYIRSHFKQALREGATKEQVM